MQGIELLTSKLDRLNEFYQIKNGVVKVQCSKVLGSISVSYDYNTKQYSYSQQLLAHLLLSACMIIAAFILMSLNFYGLAGVLIAVALVNLVCTIIREIYIQMLRLRLLTVE